MTTPTKQTKPLDLFEYTEEAILFDVVIRRIAQAKPVHRVAPKAKLAKNGIRRSLVLEEGCRGHLANVTFNSLYRLDV